MLKPWILGPLFGGLALFAWLGLSWAVLPFHMAQFHTFGDEPAAQDFLRSQSVQSGIYMLPGMPEHAADKTHAEQRSAMAQDGPSVTFMAVRADGFDKADPAPFIKGTLYSILAALLATLILMCAGASLPTFGCRWRACIAMGAIIALAGPLTTGAFFLIPAGHLVVETLDHIIGWTCLGAVLAWSTKPTAVATKEARA